MRKLVKPSRMDSEIVDLFDTDRLNEFGGPYCVAPGILPEEVDEWWASYRKSQTKPEDIK